MVHSLFPAVTMFNIPDILRFHTRSWDACAITSAILPSLPHLRAMDLSPTDDASVARHLLESRTEEVLIVQGDAPRDTAHVTYDTTTVSAIARLKHSIPGLRVYAAVDPYRQSFRAEREYIKRKLDAGADGFFTQPFFDVRLLEIYADLLRDQTVFWGVTPVLTEGARSYWEMTNSAVFPANFTLTLDANVSLARRLIEAARSARGHVYVMPLRVDLKEYLRRLFEV